MTPLTVIIKYVRLPAFMYFILCVFALQAHAAQPDYIIDTDIGGDVDDVLALLVAMAEPVKPLAITTTHIEPMEKARIAKLIVTLTGHPEIPVYAGAGNTRQDSRAQFLQQNPLWPPVFGYPAPSQDAATWFPKQALSYRNSFGPLLEKVKIEKESAPKYIARLAKSYSPQHKLVIITLGPLHNIYGALMLDPAISQNIKIYAMGGEYPKGYNWLVSPSVSAPVLKNVESIAILSSLIEANQFYITSEEFADMEKNMQSALGRAIIQDWKNWYKMEDGHARKTHLSDPVTLYLALHSDDITGLQAKDLNFPCLDQDGKLQPAFNGLWYNMPGLENKIMVATDVITSRTQFVTAVRSASIIRKKIIAAIKSFDIVT